ncbi:MAG: transferase [Bacteroidaceae bacterium]|nr:transferase [Bacteroidaceae bacterium]
MKEIYALGIGHNTPVFIDLAEACGYRIAGLYHYNDSRTGEYDHGFEILGSFDDLLSLPTLSSKNFLLTMGNNNIRAELFEKILKKGGNIPSLIHPTAVISRFASIAESGVYISPFVYLQADSSIDKNTVVLSHVNISHNTTIGKNCFLAGNATVGAYTVVEDGVFIGQGALTISAKVSKIGKNAYIAARALVTKDVPENVIVVGAPARVMEK